MLYSQQTLTGGESHVYGCRNRHDQLVSLLDLQMRNGRQEKGNRFVAPRRICPLFASRTSSSTISRCRSPRPRLRDRGARQPIASAQVRVGPMGSRAIRLGSHKLRSRSRRVNRLPDGNLENPSPMRVRRRSD